MLSFHTGLSTEKTHPPTQRHSIGVAAIFRLGADLVGFDLEPGFINPRERQFLAAVKHAMRPLPIGNVLRVPEDVVLPAESFGVFADVSQPCRADPTVLSQGLQ